MKTNIFKQTVAFLNAFKINKPTWDLDFKILSGFDLWQYGLKILSIRMGMEKLKIDDA